MTTLPSPNRGNMGELTGQAEEGRENGQRQTMQARVLSIAPVHERDMGKYLGSHIQLIIDPGLKSGKTITVRWDEDQAVEFLAQLGQSVFNVYKANRGNNR